MLRKLLIIAVVFGSVAVAHAQKKEKKKKNNESPAATTTATTDTGINYRLIGAPLPKLYVHTLDEEKLTEKDFNKGGYLLIMSYNPTCDHCQTMTLNLEQNIDKFNKTEILLVSAPSLVSYLEFFNNVTRHSKYPKIKVGVDSSGYINKTFEYGSLPQINIYDKSRKLVKVFLGETDMEKLKPYME